MYIKLQDVKLKLDKYIAASPGLIQLSYDLERSVRRLPSGRELLYKCHHNALEVPAAVHDYQVSITNSKNAVIDRAALELKVDNISAEQVNSIQTIITKAIISANKSHTILSEGLEAVRISTDSS